MSYAVEPRDARYVTMRMYIVRRESRDIVVWLRAFTVCVIPVNAVAIENLAIQSDVTNRRHLMFHIYIPAVSPALLVGEDIHILYHGWSDNWCQVAIDTDR